ncbi:MAG: glycine cleavage system aminomethyltransferase GcvT [Thermoprotei archaeon]
MTGEEKREGECYNGEGKRTPLAATEEGLGARFQAFHGWITPLYFSSITSEVLSVRHSAGVFDVSHMGRLLVSGDDLPRIGELFTNNVESTKKARMKYSYMLRPDGTIIDDLVSYGLEEGLLLVVNASALSADLAWLDEHGVHAEDVTDKTAMIAVQGPSASGIASSLGFHLGQWFSFESIDGWESCWKTGIVSRSGYTGEDGFELIGDIELVKDVYNRVLSLGASPAGLGARDVLRIEAGYALSGVETAGRTPLDIGGGRFIKWQKSFIGRSAIEGKQERSLFGFVSDGGIPRAGFISDEGLITSGTFSPTLKRGIGLVVPFHEVPAPGTPITFTDPETQRKLSGKVAALPFVPWRYPMS